MVNHDKRSPVSPEMCHPQNPDPFDCFDNHLSGHVTGNYVNDNVATDSPNRHEL